MLKLWSCVLFPPSYHVFWRYIACRQIDVACAVAYPTHIQAQQEFREDRSISERTLLINYLPMILELVISVLLQILPIISYSENLEETQWLMQMEKLRFWRGIVSISKVCLFVNRPAITSNTTSNEPLRLNCFIFARGARDCNPRPDASPSSLGVLGPQTHFHIILNDILSPTLLTILASAVPVENLTTPNSVT
jgi:hypothetical protein